MLPSYATVSLPQVTEDKENQGRPQQASTHKPAASPSERGTDDKCAGSAADHAGDHPTAGSDAQAEPDECPSSSKRHTGSPAQRGVVNDSAVCRASLSVSAAPDTKSDDRGDNDMSEGGDVSDAGQSRSQASDAEPAESGVEMWDEEDELDDAFRQERMAGVTLEAGGHDGDCGREHLVAASLLLPLFSAQT